MRDLSLHLLDLAENSVRAGATVVELSVRVDENRQITLVIRDDGCGMDEETVRRVVSPFATSRTTRKVGLGIPMMLHNARQTGGDLRLESQVGQGTTLTVHLDGGSIDCLPLGDLPGTVAALVTANPDKPDFVLHCASEKGEMTFDTRQLRQALDGIALNEPEIAAWMLASLREEIQPIFGGVI